MFANPIWSLLILIIPVFVYWVIIRPRLQTRLVDLYSHLDSFWDRVLARLYAFRIFLVASGSAILIAAPDLLVQVSSLDFTWLPQPWPMYVSLAFMISISLMKAFETKPGEDLPP